MQKMCFIARKNYNKMAGRAGGLAHPQTRKGVTRGPVTVARCTRTSGILPLAMKPALWGLRWRRPPRRRGLNRLHEGKQARPGREQPNPRRKRSQVTGGSEGGGAIPLVCVCGAPRSRRSYQISMLCGLHTAYCLMVLTLCWNPLASCGAHYNPTSRGNRYRAGRYHYQ